MDEYINALLEKSREAYLMALEIINKPTIKYRTEGFCFFICNAWELMLKAYLIKRENSIDVIKYKDKTNRTIGLEDCINSIFTSTDNPTRNNLNIIRSIRNRVTHLVLPEYDFKFAALYQRCLSNYAEFFKKNFPSYKTNEDLTPFVSLMKTPDSKESPLLLDSSAAELLNKTIESMDSDDAITLSLRLVSTKKDKDADIRFKLDNTAETTTTFIEVEKPTGDLYPYAAKELVSRINDTIRIELGTDVKFTMHDFTQICKKHGLKENKKYCSHTKYSQSTIVLYSEETIEYVSDIYITEYKQSKKSN